ncbi:MAG: TonB-dependent receptor, partial [Notoacmeibacter sp.]
ASDFERYAPSLSLNYSDDNGLNARLRGEARFERSEDGTRDRDTYLVSAGYVNTINPDWRVSFNADAVISQSDQATILDGDYVEASVGFAYRPVENDRLNALFKYTFLYDLPGPDQVAQSSGTLLGPAQRSHVLNADFIYDVNEYLSVGAKYGFRIGEISTTRKSSDFVTSSAHLGVLRADFHVIKNWDVLVEGRVMHLPEAGSTKFGALAAVYYHVSDHLKAGVGYNFGRFSDDLTDVTQDDEGVFLNVIGKY